MAESKQSAERTSIGRVPELDLLRFIAAASVVLYHFTYRPRINGSVDELTFWPLQGATRFGYLGVTLFFMISGFVILWSSQSRSAGEFVVSRFARLFPSFWICVLITALAVNVLAASEPVSLRTAIVNLTMIPGVVGVPYVDGVYWTLFVELKFYLLVFLVLATNSMARVEIWLALWLAAATASMVGIAPKWVASLSLHPYGPYFISGCLFYLLRARGPTRFRLAALVLSCILGAWYAVTQQPDFMHDTSRASGFIVAFAVVVFHMIFAAIALVPAILPASRWWYWLGGLTYPLYLLHNRISKAIWANLTPAHSTWTSLAIQLVVALTLSAIIAAAVERRAVGVFHKALVQTGVRFRVLRPTSA